jgi:hypothetical protein
VGRSITIFGITALSLLVGCGGTEDPFERLTKLRGIGVKASPVVSQPSTDATPQSVQLTVYAALPAGKTADVEAYEDVVAPNVAKIAKADIIIDQASKQYDDYNGIRVLSFNATVKIPNQATFFTDPTNPIRNQIRYGFKLSSESEEEIIVGNHLVVPSDDTRLSLKDPTIAIDTPSDTADVKKDEDVKLVATVSNPNKEQVKVGWFVTSGEITNRRAKSTLWNKFETGAQTVIVTAHGKDSKGFAMSVVQVTVN